MQSHSILLYFYNHPFSQLLMLHNQPFTKTGNWPLRDDVPNDKNPVSLKELGARANDVDGIYSIFPDVQDMWTYWRDQAPK